MSVAAGQILAFLKIGVVAFAIMAALWLLIRFVEKRGREKNKDNG
jgi:hypothetical protein